MKLNDDELGIQHDDDSRDHVAAMLRQQAPHARLSAPADLRERTVSALRASPSTQPVVSIVRRPEHSILAAAALIALAALIYFTVIAPKDPLKLSEGPGAIARNNADDAAALNRLNAARSGSREFVAASTARLATFTQPLEDEAQALSHDLKRVAARVRQAIPKARLNPSSQ